MALAAYPNRNQSPVLAPVAWITVLALWLEVLLYRQVAGPITRVL